MASVSHGALAASIVGLTACLVDVDASLLERSGAASGAADAGASDARAGVEADAASRSITAGVPHGTQLTVSGSRVVDEPGAVLDALDIEGCIKINANDVTVRRSRIKCSSLYAIQIEQGVTGTLIEDVEIIESKNAGIVYGGYTARRVEIHGYARKGFHFGGNTTIEDCYVHDPQPGSDAAAFSMSGDNVVLRRNVFDVGLDADAAVFVNASNEAASNVLVSENWLNGGRNTVIASATGSSAEPAIRITSNRFGRTFESSVRKLGTGVLWSENVWADTGESAP